MSEMKCEKCLIRLIWAQQSHVQLWKWEKGCQALYHYRESIVLITGALLMTRRRALSLSASVPNSLDELVLEARLRRRTILAVHVAHSINPAAALDLARGWHPS